MSHSEIVTRPREPELNGDESRSRLYELCSDALDRLDIFRWEWMSDQSPKGKDFVRRRKKPITVETGINADGLLEAAEEVATVVQRQLHELESPLEMLVAADLWLARSWYLTALIYRGGNRLAKDVEVRVTPSRQPLAICLGSARQTDVTTIIGQLPMHGYTGCLRTFPDAAYGPGRRWPRLCPDCRPKKSNAKNKAIATIQRRAELISHLRRAA